MIRLWIRHGGKEDPEALFLQHLEFIDRTARSVARRHGYESEDAHDFCSHVKIKLLEDNYAVFRKYQGRSSLTLYLRTVIHRLYIDHEIAQKGKWRPSTTAQRMGPIAVELEQLLYWKHHTLEEAYQILNSKQGIELERDSLYEIAQKLPRRRGKTSVQYLPLDDMRVPEPAAQRDAPDPETEQKAKHLARIVKGFVERLSGADRLMLKMRFQDDFTFEEIARFVKEKKLQVYWRLRRILVALQEELRANSLSKTEVRNILATEEKRIDIDF